MAKCQWGKILQWRVIAEGLYAVEAERNGGLMIAEDFATANLSIAARMRAVTCWLGGYQTWYCYSRDAFWAIVALELPEHLCNDVFRVLYPGVDVPTADDRRRLLVRLISRTNADYLISQHIKPDLDALHEWLAEMTEHDLDEDDGGTIDLSSNCYPLLLNMAEVATNGKQSLGTNPIFHRLRSRL